MTPILDSFGFRSAGQVIFGPGRAADLPELVAAWGARALVVTGTRPGRHGALIAALPMPA